MWWVSQPLPGCCSSSSPDPEPDSLDALIDWPAGEVAALVASQMFLLATFVPPVVAIRAARQAQGEARKRLVLVAVVAVAEIVLVVGCSALGAVGSASGQAGEDATVTALFAGMYAAVAVVGTGTALALRTPCPVTVRLIAKVATGLVALTVALVALILVLTLDFDGPLSVVGAAAVACGVMLALRPLESRLTRALLAPALDPIPEEGSEPSRDAAAQVSVEALTERESEVLGLLAEGLSNAGIAARLTLSDRTVDAHLRSVFAKLTLPESPAENRRVHAAVMWHRASAEQTASALANQTRSS